MNVPSTVSSHCLGKAADPWNKLPLSFNPTMSYIITGSCFYTTFIMDRWFRRHRFYYGTAVVLCSVFNRICRILPALELGGWEEAEGEWGKGPLPAIYHCSGWLSPSCSLIKKCVSLLYLFSRSVVQLPVLIPKRGGVYPFVESVRHTYRFFGGRVVDHAAWEVLYIALWTTPPCPWPSPARPSSQSPLLTHSQPPDCGSAEHIWCYSDTLWNLYVLHDAALWLEATHARSYLSFWLIEVC